ncbi:MAG: cation:proton antiporter [Bacteroidales bacterium]|nr:cation:proton antiporter [Bacteroidales bacterium]
MIGNISFDVNFIPLMVVVSIAWAIPMLMNILGLKKIPTVIVEILAGYFIGRFFLPFLGVEGIKNLEFLALSGFLFLMFESGLEININKIVFSFSKKSEGKKNLLENPLIAGLVIFASTLLLSFISAWGLNQLLPIKNIWYFSLILVTTSVGIILPVLKNRGETETKFGQMLVTGAAVADILSIILFTFTAFILRHGFQPEILLILAIFLAFYTFYYIGVKIHRKTFIRRIIHELSHAASQIQVRGTILLILVFIVMAQYLGEEVLLLGAFLSGILLSAFVSKERNLLLQKLHGMSYGFFIPIFFIMVGAEFDTSALQHMDQSLVLFLVLLLVILYLVKIIPNLLLTKIFGFRKSLAAGFLMASRLSLIIAASKIGLDLNIISPGTNAVFIIMAVITCLISPIIYNYIHPIEPHKTGSIIIVGGSSTAVLLARRLKMHGKFYTIIEKDPERFKEIRSKGLNILLGDGTVESTYDKIELDPESYVVVLTGNNDTNYRISKFLRERFNHEFVLTKAYSLAMEDLYNAIEVQYMDVTRVLATTIENYLLRPTTYSAVVESFENFSIEEMQVTGDKYDRAQLKDIPFHQNASLLLYKRGEVMDLPHGDTQLMKGDKVFVFGTNTALEDTREKLTS